MSRSHRLHHSRHSHVEVNPRSAQNMTTRQKPKKEKGISPLKLFGQIGAAIAMG